MAQGSSPPPPEIRSPDERAAAEDPAEAEAGEVVFDDAFDIPHKNAPHDRLRRWRVRDRLPPLTVSVPFGFGSSVGLSCRGSGLRPPCVVYLDLEIISAYAVL